ncbi:MAG: FRG domain-containing protein [Oscillospiraceae bacterium]|nr:FRG domain-containing protein [Oscillospiraceae bacterium]
MEIFKTFNNPKDLFMWLINPDVSSEFYFRGISAPEQIYPSIMRTNGNDLSDFEDYILQNFIRYGSSLVGNINNAFDCVGYAQHFGLPTRLVDWSKNPLIALFFSIYYNITEDNKTPQLLLLPRTETMPIYEPVHFVTNGEVGISYRSPIRDYSKFVKNVKDGHFAKLCIATSQHLDDMMDYTLAPYSDEVTRKDEAGQMIMINPGYSNSRILVQDGLFYMPRKLKTTEIDQEYTASKVSLIQIDKNWRTQLLKMLDCVGISKYRLFFDLSNICGYITEKTELLNKQPINWTEPADHK